MLKISIKILIASFEIGLGVKFTLKQGYFTRKVIQFTHYNDDNSVIYSKNL
jgi:hypothetical protein